MPKQLDKVLAALSDEKWHSLSEISKNLFIKKKSVASRIRDLRLSKYGSHKIEVRETQRPAVFEYRLIKQRSSSPTIPFLNVETLTTVHLPKEMCVVMPINDVNRIVPLDAAGKPQLQFLTLEQSF